MLADCMRGHERCYMRMSHLRRSFICPTCRSELSLWRLVEETPEPYRPQKDLMATVLQGMLDFEVMGVITMGGLEIEYLRLADAEAIRREIGAV